MGSGNGSCNSNEKKYKTRAVYINKATPEEVEQSLRKERRGNYDVYIIKQDPWEVQNTLYKMACKRALLAATLNVTAASDLFTQDVDEDFVFEQQEESPQVHPSEPKRKSESVQPQLSTPKAEVVADEQKEFSLTEKQLKRLWAIAKQNNYTEKDIKCYYKDVFKIESSKELTQDMYQDITEFMQQNPQPAGD
jgi:hypothetical protein